MGRLMPVRMTCHPRPDVLSRNLTDIHFAAQLDTIVRDPDHYPTYGNPDEFFKITYPTAGLKSLLTRVFGRLTGAPGEAGAYGLTRAETSFGGGKTHGMIAVHHLAMGARPTNLHEFIDPALMPDGPVQVAAIVGDTLDPVNGVETNGHRTYTLWGEMAAQLGDDAYAMMAASDATRTAPGTQAIREALGGRPTVVIIDEIARHARNVAESGSEDVRRSAKQISVFLKSLSEMAMSDRKLAVIVTLASSQDAYGEETDEIAELLEEAAGTYAETLGEMHSVLERAGWPIKPAQDEEIGEILKRRLFERIDEDAAQAAGEHYRDLYERVLAQDQQLGGGAAQPASYGDLVARSYPFHPELVRVLDKRLGDIPSFNRARGALKLLSEVVASIWGPDGNEADAEMINVADIDYGREEIRNMLTVALNRPQFGQVAEVDLAGSGSHAAMLDKTRFAGRAPYATRACRTVFTHSLESKRGVGAGRSDYLLGTLRVDDDAELVDEALREAEKVCWHLSYDGTRWRFHTEPNVNRIIDDEKRNIPNSAAAEATNDAIRDAFKNDAGAQVILFPAGPANVAEAETLRVAVVHHDLLDVTTQTALQKPPSLLAEILDNVGMSGGIRKNRNTVVFVVADADAVDTLKDRVRTKLAVERIANDHDRLADFTDQVRSKIEKAKGDAGVNQRVSVTRCYKHVYFPADDAAHDYLRHAAVPPEGQGDTRSATRMVIDLLKDEQKIRTDRFAYTWLRAKTWPPPKESTTTADIEAWFYRDHGAPILLGDPTYIKDAIRGGIRGEGWVYHEIPSGKTYTGSSTSPNVQLSSDVEIMTKAEANRRGLLVKEPTLPDLYAVVPGPRHSGTEVRAGLEARTGGEPTKTKVLELLATAVGNERYQKIVVTDVDPAQGVTALTPTQIRQVGLDTVTVLTRAEADRLGVKMPDRIVTPELEKRGPAGTAFQELANAVSDRGKPVQRLSVMAFAGEETGTGDVNLLEAALGQLPRQEISVEAKLRAEIPGMGGGFDLKVTGDRASYQQLRAKLNALLQYAAKVTGSIRLDISFTAEIEVSTDEWKQTHTVFKNLAPKDVKVKAVLAP